MFAPSLFPEQNRLLLRQDAPRDLNRSLKTAAPNPFSSRTPLGPRQSSRYHVLKKTILYRHMCYRPIITRTFIKSMNSKQLNDNLAIQNRIFNSGSNLGKGQIQWSSEKQSRAPWHDVWSSCRITELGGREVYNILLEISSRVKYDIYNVFLETPSRVTYDIYNIFLETSSRVPHDIYNIFLEASSKVAYDIYNVFLETPSKVIRHLQ